MPPKNKPLSNQKSFKDLLTSYVHNQHTAPKLSKYTLPYIAIHCLEGKFPRTSIQFQNFLSSKGHHPNRSLNTITKHSLQQNYKTISQQ